LISCLAYCSTLKMEVACSPKRHTLARNYTWSWVVSFTSWPLYSQSKTPWYPLDRSLRGPESRSRPYERRLLPLPEIEPRFFGSPARSLVAIPTETSTLIGWIESEEGLSSSRITVLQLVHCAGELLANLVKVKTHGLWC
jgi:hypothetical protein